MNLRVLLYPGEDGYIVAECPALPGCASQGRNREEAVRNIREAIQGWLEVQDVRAQDQPRSSGVEAIEVTV